MADEIISENLKERERLLPVAGIIFLCFLVILGGSYFIGNLIYQIPG